MAECFDEMLGATAMIGPRLSQHDFFRATIPQGTAANSGRLVTAAGPGWLAVGDAATADV